MKSPDTIYFDEVWFEVKRHSVPGEHAGDPRSIDETAFRSALFTARETVVYHLVYRLGFPVGEANDVAEEFESIGPVQDRLKHKWTDICLKRDQRH